MGSGGCQREKGRPVPRVRRGQAAMERIMRQLVPHTHQVRTCGFQMVVHDSAEHFSRLPESAGREIVFSRCPAQRDHGKVLGESPIVDVVRGTHNVGSPSVLLERVRGERGVSRDQRGTRDLPIGSPRRTAGPQPLRQPVSARLHWRRHRSGSELARHRLDLFNPLIDEGPHRRTRQRSLGRRCLRPPD
jgi:hypothetical protein